MKMIALHRQRFKWTHNEPAICANFINFADADNDLEPICLKNKEWIFIKEDIEQAVLKFPAPPSDKVV
jgi:hypothetical protein